MNSKVFTTNLFQDQKSALEQERKHLHKVVEKEHRFLVSEKAKIALSNRLKSNNNNGADFRFIEDFSGNDGDLNKDDIKPSQHPFRQVRSLLLAPFFQKIDTWKGDY